MAKVKARIMRGHTPLCRLCEEREAHHPESGLCKRCYSWLNYWMGATVTHFMKRVDTLKMWDTRAAKVAEMLAPTRMPSRTTLKKVLK